jgi:hypothetical protein
MTLFEGNPHLRGLRSFRIFFPVIILGRDVVSINDHEVVIERGSKLYSRTESEAWKTGCRGKYQFFILHI